MSDTELLRQIADFAQQVARPANDEIERTQRIPAAVWNAAAELGLFKLVIPRQYGGLGCDMQTSARVIEILCYACLPLGIYVAVAGTTIQPLLLTGNEEQRVRVFDHLLKTRGVACDCFTEREAGSDLRSMSLQATRTAGGYVLNGGKMFCFLGGVAEVFAVWARSENGHTPFLVWPKAEGLRISDELPRMGLRGVSLVELAFDNVFVPERDMLGEEGKGFIFSLLTINKGRLDIGAQAVGLAQSALDYAMDYLAEREQFGKPVIDYQAVQLRLANMAIEISGVKLMVERCAKALDANDPMSVRYCAELKIAASEMAVSVTSNAVQLLGGHGVLKEHPVERLARDATAYRVMDGTNDINRMRVAAELMKEAKRRRTAGGVRYQKLA